MAPTEASHGSRILGTWAFVAVLGGSTVARAESPHATVNGKQVTVRVSDAPNDHSLAVCVGSTCTRVPIDAVLDESSMSVQSVRIGKQEELIFVRARDKSRDRTLELVAKPGETPLFSGWTGGPEAIRFVVRPDGTSLFMRGKLDPAVGVCGMKDTLTDVTAYDGSSRTFKAVTMQQLSPDARARANELVATRRDKARPPAIRILGEPVASSGTALFAGDGNPETVWSETKAGVGQGEFVSFRVQAADVGMRRLSLVLSPTSPAAATKYVYPASIYLTTTSNVFRVRFDEDASAHPGAAWEVTLPAAVSTDCLSVVLDSAYSDRRDVAVGLAEVNAYLGVDDRADDEAAVHWRAGLESAPEARVRDTYAFAAAAELDRLAPTFMKLDLARKEAALSGSSARACEEAARFHAHALAETRLRDRATRALEACGKRAAAGMGEAFRESNDKGSIADLYAVIAPREGLVDLAHALASERGEAATDPKRLATLRRALALAARTASADDLGRVVAQHREAHGVIDILRALGSRVGEVPESQAILDRAAASKDPRTLFHVVPPLASRVEKDPSLSSRYAEVMRADSPAVRTLAVSSAPARAELDAALLAATRDESPRVREAAFLSLVARTGDVGVTEALRGASDDFAFVRAAALAVLGRAFATAALPPPAIASTLDRALDDRTVRVKVAALSALGKRANADMNRVSELLERAEPVEVHEKAAATLGAACARSGASALRARAESLASPVASAEERRVGIASAEALARIDPAGFQKLLATLRSARAPGPLVSALEQRGRSTTVPSCPK